MGRSIKAFNSNGGEYEAIDDFYKQSRIKHIYTMPYTSQQNGIAKRRSWTLLDMTRSMMSSLEMSIQFLGEALSKATYILNKVFTKANL